MNIIKISALNIALYTFFTLNPYFKWLLPNEYFYAFFLFTTLLLSYQLKRYIKNSFHLDFHKKHIIFFLIIYIIYFTTPIVHSFRWGHLAWSIPFLIIITYSDNIINLSYIYLKKIIIFFTITALIVWLINLLSIPIPYYSFYPNFRLISDDYYRIYGPCISLYNGSLPVGGVYGIERITGVFAEPGHFGIYLGLILAVEKFNLNSRENKILTLVGILTFSTAFMGILLLGLLYRFYLEKKLIKIIPRILFYIITFVLLGLIFGEGFNKLMYERVFIKDGKQINTLTELVESRINERSINEFDEFTKTSNYIFGVGYSEGVDMPTTNWRGVVYRFGIIGLLIIIVLLITIVKRVDVLYAILLLAFAIIILVHRSYFFYVPSVYILLFIATNLNKKLIIKHINI